MDNDLTSPFSDILAVLLPSFCIYFFPTTYLEPSPFSNFPHQIICIMLLTSLFLPALRMVFSYFPGFCIYSMILWLVKIWSQVLPIRENMWHLLFRVWGASLNMIFSSFIILPAMFIISLFFTVEVPHFHSQFNNRRTFRLFLTGLEAKKSQTRVQRIWFWWRSFYFRWRKFYFMIMVTI